MPSIKPTSLLQRLQRSIGAATPLQSTMLEGVVGGLLAELRSAGPLPSGCGDTIEIVSRASSKLAELLRSPVAYLNRAEIATTRQAALQAIEKLHDALPGELDLENVVFLPSRHLPPA